MTSGTDRHAFTAALPLLLPELPGSLVLSQELGHWAPSLRQLGLDVQHHGHPDRPPHCLVTADARAAAGTTADLIILAGRDRRHLLAAAGYATQTWTALRGAGGTTLLVPDRGEALTSTVPGSRPRTLRRIAGDVLLRPRPTTVTTAALPSYAEAPALVRAAGGEQWLARHVVVGGGGPRRRIAVFAGDPGAGPRVIKAGHSPDGPERSRREQRVLTRVHIAGRSSSAENGVQLSRSVVSAPLPLGSGQLGPLSWSVETATSGTPLGHLLGDRRSSATALVLLRHLTTWFAELGAATAGRRSWGAADDAGLTLDGPHRALDGVRAHLTGVPGVLVHGDVATAGNILVGDTHSSVIDWETGTEDSLPLVDVLPLLCLSLARLAQCRGPEAEAAYVLRLCEGREAESRLLFDHVRGYCRRVHVPLERAGALAALSWGYVASMRLLHEKQVQAAGGAVRTWRTASDEVAAEWMRRPTLSLHWTALTGPQEP